MTEQALPRARERRAGRPAREDGRGNPLPASRGVPSSPRRSARARKQWVLEMRVRDDVGGGLPILKGKMPKIADLFCGAGGAGMGLHRAGFEVVGFDIKPQPRYPFELHQADALTVDLSGFDAVWASPPCQFYSRLRHLPWLKDRVYWRSIPPTREACQSSGKPYIIENVADARWDMDVAATLCGKTFGLHLFRHRCFETSWFLLAPPHERHTEFIAAGRATLRKRHHGLNGWGGPAGHQGGIERHKAQMGIDWMTSAELAQAVPPAYSEYLGKELRRALTAPDTKRSATP